MIQLVDISKYYRSSQNIALGLHKINLTFEPGEFVAITGESGSGKSTLLNVISGSDTYEDGELYFNGEETSYYDAEDWENYRKEKIAFIYQNYNLIDSFSVIDNVKTAMFIVNPLMEETQAEQKAYEYLNQVGLKEQAGKKATQLSSGQKQRLSIARALAKDTDILVADEPTGNLDVENSRQIIEILNELSKQKLVFIVTHNYDEVDSYVTRKIRMYDGEVAEDIRLRENRKKQTESIENADTKTKSADNENAKPEGTETSDRTQEQPEKIQNRYLARRMLKKIRRAKPHSLLVLMLLFVFIFTSIYVFVGTFDKNMDYSTAKTFSDNTYANGDKTRISVRKPDGSAMTEEDFEKLQTLQHITYVDFYDMVNDISYMDEENEDYTYTYRTSENMQTRPPDKVSVKILDQSKMLRSVTGLSANDVTKGELPQEMQEILVTSKDKSLVGQTMKVIFNRKNNWESSCVSLEMQITGITQEGEEGQIYISKKLAAIFNLTAQKMTGYSFYADYSFEGYGLDVSAEYTELDIDVDEDSIERGIFKGQEILAPIFLVNETLTGNEVILSDNLYSDSYTTDVIPPTINIQRTILPNAYLKFGETYAPSWVAFHVINDISNHGNKVVEISQEMFDKLYPDQNSYQMTVYTSDYAYTDRVIKAIEKMGYEAVSVFRAGSTQYSEDLVTEQTMLMAVSLAALIAVFVVGILLIRIMMNNRKKDYDIMILLGMKRSIVDEINRRDICLNGIIAAVCTILLVNLAKLANIPYIASAVRYYEGVDYAVYLVVIVAMLALLYRSVKLVRKKNRRNV